MRLEDIVTTSASIGETRSRRTKIELIAGCLRRTDPEEVPIAVAYLSGRLPQGTIGVGWASLRDRPAPADEAMLELLGVDAAFQRIRTATGAGSQKARRLELAALLGAATETEQEFLARLLMGELRQGALEGTMVEGVAVAVGVDPAEVRRALMVAGDLGVVASAGDQRWRGWLAGTAAGGPPPGLADAGANGVRPGRRSGRDLPRRSSGSSTVCAFRSTSRRGRCAPSRVPSPTSRSGPGDRRGGVASRTRLGDPDGEAIALRPDGRPQPFQVTGSRFASRVDVEGQRRSVPLSPFFFDLLHVDGELTRSTPDRRTCLALGGSPPRIAARPPDDRGGCRNGRTVPG